MGFMSCAPACPRRRSATPDTVRSYKSLARWRRAFRCLKTVDLHVARFTTGSRIGCARMCSFACWPITSKWHLRQRLAPMLFGDGRKGGG